MVIPPILGLKLRPYARRARSSHTVICHREAGTVTKQPANTTLPDCPAQMHYLCRLRRASLRRVATLSPKAATMTIVRPLIFTWMRCSDACTACIHVMQELVGNR